jgi:hypothetical protein
MHDCPYCGETCDCDGEDLWHDNYYQCSCECEEQEHWYNTDDEEFGCCMDDCIMSGLHYPSECHNSAMLEEQWAEQALQASWYYPIVAAWRNRSFMLRWKWSNIFKKHKPDEELPF